jgi:hypothetical protein
VRSGRARVVRRPIATDILDDEYVGVDDVPNADNSEAIANTETRLRASMDERHVLQTNDRELAIGILDRRIPVIERPGDGRTSARSIVRRRARIDDASNRIERAQRSVVEWG